jgi:hypothetical protein
MTARQSGLCLVRWSISLHLQRPPFAGGALTICDPSGPFAWRRSMDLSELLFLADQFVKRKKFFFTAPKELHQ